MRKILVTLEELRESTKYDHIFIHTRVKSPSPQQRIGWTAASWGPTCDGQTFSCLFWSFPGTSAEVFPLRSEAAEVWDRSVLDTEHVKSVRANLPSVQLWVQGNSSNAIESHLRGEFEMNFCLVCQALLQLSPSFAKRAERKTHKQINYRYIYVCKMHLYDIKAVLEGFMDWLKQYMLLLWLFLIFFFRQSHMNAAVEHIIWHSRDVWDVWAEPLSVRTAALIQRSTSS